MNRLLLIISFFTIVLITTLACQTEPICLEKNATNIKIYLDEQSHSLETKSAMWICDESLIISKIGIIPESTTADSILPQLPLLLHDTEAQMLTFTTGLGWNLITGGQYCYYTYFPYQDDYREKGLIIDYSSQIQTGNNDYSHVKDYDYLISDGIIPTLPYYAEFEMKQVSALAHFTISVPAEYSTSEFKTLSLSSDNELFCPKGLFDLKKSYLNHFPTSNEYSKGVSIRLNNVVPSDNVVDIYMKMFPAKLKGEQIEVNLWTSNGGECLTAILENQDDQEGGEKYDYLLSASKSSKNVLPGKPKDGECLNILVVGHSFGIDGTEYLPSLMTCSSITNVNVGRFHYDDCSLSRHYNYYVNNTPYSYYFCAGGNTTYSQKSISLKNVIDERYWDIIVFHQNTGLSGEGNYSSYQPYLNGLVENIRIQSINKHGKCPVFVWHMFWGTAQNYSEQVSAIRSATKEMTDDTGIALIIPSGTAIDNARITTTYDFMKETLVGEIYRDLLHVSYGVGRYLAACSWFEALISPIYGTSVVGNTFRMPTLRAGEGTDGRPFWPVDDSKALILQKCAKAAIESPFCPTVITEL